MKSIKNLIANPKEKILIKRIKIYIKKKNQNYSPKKSMQLLAKKKMSKPYTLKKKMIKKKNKI